MGCFNPVIFELGVFGMFSLLLLGKAILVFLLRERFLFFLTLCDCLPHLSSQLSVSLTMLTFYVFLVFIQKPKLHLIHS